MKCSVAVELMKKDLIAAGCTIKEMEIFLRYAELLYYVGVDEGLGMLSSGHAKPIYQIKDGVITNSFSSIKQAAKECNTSVLKIQQVLNGMIEEWNGYSYIYKDVI